MSTWFLLLNVSKVTKLICFLCKPVPFLVSLSRWITSSASHASQKSRSYLFLLAFHHHIQSIRVLQFYFPYLSQIDPFLFASATILIHHLSPKQLLLQRASTPSFVKCILHTALLYSTNIFEEPTLYCSKTDKEFVEIEDKHQVVKSTMRTIKAGWWNRECLNDYSRLCSNTKNR